MHKGCRERCLRCITNETIAKRRPLVTAARDLLYDAPERRAASAGLGRSKFLCVVDTRGSNGWVHGCMDNRQRGACTGDVADGMHSFEIPMTEFGDVVLLKFGLEAELEGGVNMPRSVF
jgi:hypothetical protein